MAIRIVDVTDSGTFGLVPPCADPGFDHRTCDYWEDADRGSKASRAAWLEAAPAGPPQRPSTPANPFAPDDADEVVNPFAPARRRGTGDQPVRDRRRPARRQPVRPDAPGPAVGRRRCAAQARRCSAAALACSAATRRCCSTVTRPRPTPSSGRCRRIPGHSACATCTRNCPDAPLPAVITCIASTAAGRHRGHARALVDAVCDDLERRGFAAVEAYPSGTPGRTRRARRRRSSG